MIKMNINSKIDWQTGIEITPQTFIEFDENIDLRHRIASRVANGNLFGIIPSTEFLNQGVFVKNTLEIDRLSCTALLRSGQILDIDQQVVVPIPMLYGEQYYLAGQFGENKLGFDKQTVPFIRPEYICGIYTLEELENSVDLFPLMKFKVDGGVFSIETEYLPPYLILSSNSRFQEFVLQYIDKIKHLAEHPNLESGEAKRTFIRYLFLLQSYSQTNRVVDFVQLLQEITQAIDYYIVTPNTETPVKVEACSQYDVLIGLKWAAEYINSAASILDNVVLEDRTIDFEKLKAEVKAELYDKLYTELHQKLYADLKDELYSEITQTLKDVLLGYANQELRESIHNQLNDELSKHLHSTLYAELYENLYSALYIPVLEEERDEFMPLI